GQSLAIFEIAIKRDVLKELGINALTNVAGKSRCIRGGIDHVAGPGGFFIAVSISKTDAVDATSFFENFCYGVQLANIHALLARIVQENVVELHPFHLVSKCLAAGDHRRRTKGEAPGLRMLAPAIGASKFVSEVGLRQLFTYTQH